MKLVNIKKMPKITIILYLCAMLMAICTMFIIYKSSTYISSLVAQGFNPSDEIVEVINYYLSSVTPFVFYTISLFSLGYIVKKVDYIIKSQEIRVDNNKYLDNESENEEDELDDLFSNI